MITSDSQSPALSQQSLPVTIPSVVLLANAFLCAHFPFTLAAPKVRNIHTGLNGRLLYVLSTNICILAVKSGQLGWSCILKWLRVKMWLEG